MSDAVHRVLVVGIDGVRLDTLRRLPTPRLDALAADGFLAPVEVDERTPTMSGPCWATIVTGVGVDKHGVWSNDFTGHRLDVFPDFATRLAQQDGRRSFVAAGWQPLMQVRDGGPLFRAPSRTAYVSPAADNPEAWETCDERITEEAAGVLARDDLDASFVYLGAPDETAHVLGCGDAYDAAVLRADARVGRLLDAVRSRLSYDDEQWTFLVVTDHGHVDAGGHGGRSERERTAWLIAAGPGIRVAPSVVRHVDVAAQVFASLGCAADRHWTLDGRPFMRPCSAELDGDLLGDARGGAEVAEGEGEGRAGGRGGDGGRLGSHRGDRLVPGEGEAGLHAHRVADTDDRGAVALLADHHGARIARGEIADGAAEPEGDPGEAE
jgi:hypothetical protein